MFILMCDSNKESPWCQNSGLVEQSVQRSSKKKEAASTERTHIAGEEAEGAK